MFCSPANQMGDAARSSHFLPGGPGRQKRQTGRRPNQRQLMRMQGNGHNGMCELGRHSTGLDRREKKRAVQSKSDAGLANGFRHVHAREGRNGSPALGTARPVELIAFNENTERWELSRECAGCGGSKTHQGNDCHWCDGTGRICIEEIDTSEWQYRHEEFYTGARA
jgi:hypothetical protein